MISEGTNIPRLKVCCYLTRVKTELYFRQVLGRVLRVNGTDNDKGYLFMPAEPVISGYALRVSEDIPYENVLKFESIHYKKNRIKIIKSEFETTNGKLKDMFEVDEQINFTGNNAIGGTPSLSRGYENSLDLFGNFQRKVFTLNGHYK